MEYEIHRLCFKNNEKSLQEVVELQNIVNAREVQFYNCEFFLKGRSDIYPMWHNDWSSSLFSKCKIYTEHRGFVASGGKNNKVVISECVLSYTGTSKMKTYMPYLQIKNLEFVDNVIILSADKLRETSRYDSLIQNANKVKGNKFFYGDKLIINPRVSFSNSNVID